jgi:magnesium transporter
MATLGASSATPTADPGPGSIVDCALYEDGVRRGGRVPLPVALESARQAAARRAPRDGAAPEAGHSFVWIMLDEPSEEDLERVAEEFGLHPLAVEDAVHAHERPKLETYGDVVFAVLKTARYVDSDEVIEMGELMLFLGSDFVIMVSHHSALPLEQIRDDLEQNPKILRHGPAAVLYAVTDRVVDDYVAACEGVENDVEEIEAEVFSGDRTNRAERIYKLKREVLDFRRAVVPLVQPVERLAKGELRGIDPKTATYFRDVRDHLLRTTEQVEGFNQLLDGALDANMANVTLRQNEDMRKIAAWAAVLAWMTMIAGIYGMNFEYMPELDWLIGYPLALAAMFGGALVLIWIFRKRGWL